jgi:transposase
MHPIKYIGVDLSKHEMVSDVAAPAKPRTLSNEAQGYTQLIALLPAHAHVVCESTGGYQRGLVAALQAAGIPVSVVMPSRVRHFARARGLRAKTDPIDARLLTAFGEAMTPQPVSAPGPVLEALQALLRARQQLIEQLNLEASLAEHCIHPLLQAQAKKRCAVYKQQICAIEKQIRAAIAAEPTWQCRCERVQQVDGVGEVTAWTMLIEVPELGSLAPGQAGAIVGVVPDPNQSATRDGPRHISGGRSHVRRALYMAALTASQPNRILAEFYQRLVHQHHKPKRLALIAIMRKLAELLNLLLSDPDFKLAT